MTSHQLPRTGNGHGDYGSHAEYSIPKATSSLPICKLPHSPSCTATMKSNFLAINVEDPAKASPLTVHLVIFSIWSFALIPSAVALESVSYVRNEAVWKTPPIRPQGFQFEIQLLAPTASYDLEIVRRSIHGHNLGEYDSTISKVMAAEWGYSFTHLDGQTDGAGGRIKAGYVTPPTNRAECLTIQDDRQNVENPM